MAARSSFINQGRRIAINEMASKSEHLAPVSGDAKDNEDDREVEEEREDETGLDSREQRVKRAKESLPLLKGSTHSNSDVVSTIMSAQNRIFGPLRLEELGPEEKSRARTHYNPLAKQYLTVSCANTLFSGAQRCSPH